MSLNSISKIVFLLIIINGCSDCDDEDLEQTKPYYDIIGINSKLAKITDISPIQYIQYEMIDSENDTINFDELFIRNFADLRFHAFNTVKNFGTFLNSAYACEPLPAGYKGTDEKIDKIIIKSINNFDSNHLAGDTLNDFFNYVEGTKIKFSLNDYTKTFPIQAPMDFGLQLNTKPKLNLKHKFIIEYYQTNGEYYIDTTEFINLN